MKRQDLLNSLDSVFLEKLYGFCYKRCTQSTEAQELCSDILLHIVKASSKEGDLDHAEGFLWKIAHHVYADFSERRKKSGNIKSQRIHSNCFCRFQILMNRILWKRMHRHCGESIGKFLFFPVLIVTP